MFIRKGGISRNIDDKDLQVYRDKGYVKVESMSPAEPEPPKEKPLEKMTTAELEAKAAELVVDITDCKNNAERAKKIRAAQEGGE